MASGVRGWAQALGAACGLCLLVSLARAGEPFAADLTFLLADWDLLTAPDGADTSRGCAPSEQGPWPCAHEPGDSRLGLVARLAGLARFEDLAGGLDLELGLRGWLVPIQQDGEGLLRDAGSYLGLAWRLAATPAGPSRLSLQLFPLDAEPVRMGYAWGMTWGGEGVFPFSEEDWPLVPGLLLRADLGPGHLVAGFKGAAVSHPHGEDEPALPAEAALGGVLGGGLELEGWVFGAKLGAFQTDPHEDRLLIGGSYQLGYRSGQPIGPPLDLHGRRNDHALVDMLATEEPRDGFSFSVMHEGSLLAVQGEEGLLWTFGLQAALQVEAFRVFLEGWVTSGTFAMQQVYRTHYFEDDPGYALALALGFDHAFAETGLTAGMHCSLRRQLVDIGPLWVDDDPSNGVTWGGRIADENGRHLLMGRAPATPWVPGLALDLRWVPSGLVALLLELSYSHDPLRCGTRHHGSGPGFNILSYSMICLPPSEPHRLGLALAAQARF